MDGDDDKALDGVKDSEQDLREQRRHVKTGRKWSWVVIMVVWHIKGVGSNLKVIINTSGSLVGLFTVGYPLLLRDVSIF